MAAYLEGPGKRLEHLPDVQARTVDRQGLYLGRTSVMLVKSDFIIFTPLRRHTIPAESYIILLLEDVLYILSTLLPTCSCITPVSANEKSMDYMSILNFTLLNKFVMHASTFQNRSPAGYRTFFYNIIDAKNQAVTFLYILSQILDRPYSILNTRETKESPNGPIHDPTQSCSFLSLPKIIPTPKGWSRYNRKYAPPTSSLAHTSSITHIAIYFDFFSLLRSTANLVFNLNITDVLIPAAWRHCHAPLKCIVSG